MELRAHITMLTEENGSMRAELEKSAAQLAGVQGTLAEAERLKQAADAAVADAAAARAAHEAQVRRV